MSDNTPKKLLIINADDVGMTEGATAAAADLFRAGRLTSCSVAATSPDFDRAIIEIKDAGGAMGLHLNLTEGSPLSPPEKIRSLVGADGRFAGLETLLARAAAGSIKADDVAREAEAQFERALPARPGHLDGHHHVHLVPVVAKVAAGLAIEAGIKYFRPPTPGRLSGAASMTESAVFGRNMLFFAYNKIFAERGSLVFIEQGILARGTPFQLPSGAADMKSELSNILKNIPIGNAELVCHPEKNTENNSVISTPVQKSRVSEYEFLFNIDYFSAVLESGFEVAC